MHAGAPAEPHDLLTAWTFAPGVVLPIAAAGVACYVGQRRLRQRSRGRVPASWRIRCQAAGVATLAIALLSPVDPVGESLFAGHMVQHLLLTLIAAPLLVLGDVGTMMLWSLPVQGRRAAGAVLRHPAVRAAWRALTQPVAAWMLHAAALILWHIPAPYELAVRNDAVHALEHASFLATAILFWWVVAAPRARQRLSFGPALFYLFTAATISGIIGALITVASNPWYLVHARTAAAWGLTALEDQQIAGLIMWVPASVVYLVAIGGLVTPALRERALSREAVA